jgi:hypothetical protein
VVGGQRKVAVAIACGWVADNRPGSGLLRAAPGAEWPFRSLGEGWVRPWDLTQPAQLPGPTMEYLKRVRAQFLSLRQPSRVQPGHRGNIAYLRDR